MNIFRGLGKHFGVRGRHGSGKIPSGLNEGRLPLHTVLASCHPNGFIGDLRNCSCPPQPRADPPLAENTCGYDRKTTASNDRHPRLIKILTPASYFASSVVISFYESEYSTCLPIKNLLMRLNET